MQANRKPITIAKAMVSGLPAIPIILLALFLSSCTTEQKQTPYFPEKVMEDAFQMLHEYHEAVNKHGLTAEFDFLDSTKAFFWVPPGFDKALNYEEVRGILTENAPLTRGIQFEWESLRVIPIDHKIASYYGIVQSSNKNESGEVHEDRILESGTLIKRKDGWKLLSGQSVILE